MIDAASDDPGVSGVRRFFDILASNPRVSATAIQTVGRKGYDDFAIVLVTAGGEQLAGPWQASAMHEGREA